MGASVRLACVALIGWWVAPGQGPGHLQLRGPLVEWLEFRPDSLAQCRLDTVTGYSPPFWRAPYWWCSRRLIAREDVMQGGARRSRVVNAVSYGQRGSRRIRFRRRSNWRIHTM